MKTKIIKQEKNPFLKREEFLIEIESESAPRTQEVISKLGKDEKLTVVKKIDTNFGRQKFMTEVVVYEDEKSREEVETIPQKIRKKMEAEKKAAEEEAKKKAAEEAAAKVAEEEAKKAEEEKPAEESEESKPEEEKKE
jgi:ribosomal protein S24E